MTRNEIAELMSKQREVWEDTRDGEEAILDTCHAIAHQLGLEGKDKDAFMTECGYEKVWG